MDAFLFLFKEFRQSRKQSQMQLKEMLFDFLSEATKRTGSNNKNKIRKVINTISSIIEDARLSQLLTTQEIKHLKKCLEDDLLSFMNISKIKKT